MNIPYIKIKQRGEIFYLTKIKAPDLLNHVNFHYREPYSSFEKENIIIKNNAYIQEVMKRGIDLQSDEEGIQRRLQLDRINNIKKFMESDSSNFLPNTVLLSADISSNADFEENYLIYENSEIGHFEFPNDFTFSIIDGQHRIAGLSQVNELLLEELEIPAIILFNVSKSTAAKLFADINGKQKSVNKSLIYDLYSEVDKADFSEIKKYHSICENFYKNEKSPLYRQIKMLGIGSGAISQAFFIDYVRDAINKLELKSESIQVIFDHLYYYFKAYQQVFPQDWPVPENFSTNAEVDKKSEHVLKVRKSQLVKTNGFGAIMRAFPFVFESVNGQMRSYKDLVKKLENKISWIPTETTGTGKAFQNSIYNLLIKTFVAEEGKS